MSNQKAYSAEALNDFLKQAGMQGLINPATARSRRNALELLSGELTDDEREDVRRIAIDALVSRFHKLEGSSIRPETLDVYAKRLGAALTDFEAWRKDPDHFVGTNRERPRAFGRRRDQQPALSAEQQAAERITLEATENPASVIPVPIRNDCVVYIANLPLDLDVDEAERVAAVVRAFASQRNPSNGSES